ncbi:hypothetical protein OAV86_05355 [Pseudomonadales bacterium]|nr:hypothetical protein [Pseudomonadales bacterium]
MLGIDPGTTIFQRNLNTIDEAEALRLTSELNKILDIDSGTARLQMYEGALRIVREQGEYPPHVEDALAGSEDDPEAQQAIFKALPAIDQAHFRAAQEVLGGRSRPAEYTATMRQLHDQWRPAALRINKEKTVDRAAYALNGFLGVSKDMPLALITQDYVQSVVDGWVDEGRYQFKTIKNQLQVLGAIVDHAKKRKLIDPKADNPFHGIEKGKNNSKRTKMMGDDMLREVLTHIEDDEHRLPALIARATGMRLEEIFEATIVEEEGITCFLVDETPEYQEGPKTEAGYRLVPIRDDLLEAVRTYHPCIQNQKAYSKRFSRAKVKVTDEGRRLCFHSLRVSFITKALREGFTEMQVAWLAGHEESKGESMTGSLYHKGYSVAALKEIVEAVPVFEM